MQPQNPNLNCLYQIYRRKHFMRRIHLISGDVQTLMEDVKMKMEVQIATECYEWVLSVKWACRPKCYQVNYYLYFTRWRWGISLNDLLSRSVFQLQYLMSTRICVQRILLWCKLEIYIGLNKLLCVCVRLMYKKNTINKLHTKEIHLMEHSFRLFFLSLHFKGPNRINWNASTHENKLN